MTKHAPLEQIIRRKTLPRLTLLLVALALMIGSVTYSYLQRSIEKDHQTSLSGFKANIENRIKLLRSEVRVLSQNDLIINALIDFEVRTEFLPTFFQSLRLGNTDEAALIYTDFSGDIITSQDVDLYAGWEKKPFWQKQVLEEGQEFVSFTQDGVFIAMPVFYSDLPEGALLLYLPDNYDAFISTTIGLPGTLNYLLADQAGNVLFNSKEEDNSSLVTEPDPQTIQYQSQDERFVYLSRQDSTEAYRDLLWIGIFSVASIVVVFLGGHFSIRLASRTAVLQLFNMEHALAKHSEGDRTIPIRAEDSREISSLKNAYNELFSKLSMTSDSLAKFEGIFNSLNEMLLVVDLDKQLILSNRPLQKFKTVFFNDANVPLNQLIPNTMDDQQILEIDYRDDQGKYVTIAWKKRLYLGPDERILGTIYVGSDVTQTRQAQAELEIKNQAIENAHTSVVISEYTQGLPIAYVNPAFTKLTGYTAEEVIGDNCRFLQGPETDPQALKEIRTALDKAEAMTVTLLNYRKDGSTFYNDLTLSPILNAKGEVSHILGLQADVSTAEDQKQLLASAKEKAEESARLKSDFLASMSHEIRTPMNGVLGMLHLLMDSGLNPQQSHHARLAKTSADSLLDIINDILDFSKIEAGKLELESVKFDLPSMLGDLAESMSQRAEEKGNQIILDVSELDYRTVECDAGRVRQVASNLLSNAVKFTENGEIVLRAYLRTLEDGQVNLVCEVEDNGIGIPLKRQDAIFDSFTQADSSTTRRYGGTGLGLSICKQLAEAMNGSIRLQSAEGKGSTFSFDVRLSQPPVEFDRIQRPDLAGQHILILEDSAGFASSMASTLQKMGADVTHCHSLDAVMSEVEAKTYQIAFVEYHLLEQNGIKACQTLKERNGAHLACILMTQLTDIIDPDELKSASIDTHFPKPATLDDLLEAIQSVLRKGTTTSAEVPEMTLDQPLCDDGQKKRILLVEDNPINQLLAKTLLEDLNLEVDVANHGVEAIEMLHAQSENEPENSYRVIFMDCQMPKMDGYETTACIRIGEAGNAFQNIPIIAMTANAIKGDREKCLDAGMDDYISKPIDIDTLKACVGNWLK